MIFCCLYLVFVLVAHFVFIIFFIFYSKFMLFSFASTRICISLTLTHTYYKTLKKKIVTSLVNIFFLFFMTWTLGNILSTWAKTENWHICVSVSIFYLLFRAILLSNDLGVIVTRFEEFIYLFNHIFFVTSCYATSAGLKPNFYR